MGELLPGYHGPFSSTTEWHALAIGIYGGLKDFKDWNGLDRPAKQNPDVQAEPHYAKGGYILGSLLRVGFYLLLGSQAVGVFPL